MRILLTLLVSRCLTAIESPARAAIRKIAAWSLAAALADTSSELNMTGGVWHVPSRAVCHWIANVSSAQTGC